MKLPLQSPWVRRGAVIALLGVHFTLAWVSRAPGVLTRQDDANYLILAKGLESLEYRDTHLVDAPAHRRYPPGYPAFLAVLDVLPGDLATAAIVTNIALSTAALALAFMLMEPVFGVGIALAGLGVAAVNRFVIDLAGVPIAEPLFTVLALAALLVFVRSRSPRATAIAGALALAAAGTRIIGVTLVVALGGALLLRGRLRAAIHLRHLVAATAVIAVTVGAWLVFSFSDPNALPGSSYAADFTLGSRGSGVGLIQRVVVRIGTNVPLYAASRIPAMLPLPTPAGTKLDNLLGGALVVTGLGWGLYALIAAGVPVIALYILSYLGLLVIWPYQEPRFLTPLLCLLIPVVLGGLHRALGKWGPRTAHAGVAVVVAVLAVYGLRLETDFGHRYGSCTRDGEGFPSGACLTSDQASFFAALDGVRAHSPLDAVFLSSKPEPLFYYTRRRSVDLRPLASGSTDPWSYLQSSNVNWVLMGGLKRIERTDFPTWLEPHCRRISVVGYYPPRTWLLQIASDTVRGRADACAAIAEAKALGADPGEGVLR